MANPFICSVDQGNDASSSNRKYSINKHTLFYNAYVPVLTCHSLSTQFRLIFITLYNHLDVTQGEAWTGQILILASRKKASPPPLFCGCTCTTMWEIGKVPLFWRWSKLIILNPLSHYKHLLKRCLERQNLSLPCSCSCPTQLTSMEVEFNLYIVRQSLWCTWPSN